MNSYRNLLVVSLLAAACTSKQDQPASQSQQAVQVTAVKVKSESATYSDEYPATTRALNEVDLRSQVSGYITGIHFQEGSRIKKGQKLYTIDQQQPEAALKQAQANLAQQEANLEKARKDLQRYQELDKKDAIAKQQVDYAQTAYETAQKQVDAARAAVQSMQTNVRYTTITAPFEGTIGISNVRLGAAVTPGQTVLNTISSDDPMAVDITVDQSEIFRFTNMLSGKQSKADTVFRLSFKGTLYPFPGTLSFIDRAVDPRTGTITLRLVFPNPDHVLRPGMTGTVLIKNHIDDAILIPNKAVTEQLGEFFVYVVDGDKASQQRIHPGKQIGTDIIVEQGLKPGAVVITQGVQNVREGTPVTYQQPQATTN